MGRQTLNSAVAGIERPHPKRSTLDHPQ